MSERSFRSFYLFAFDVQGLNIPEVLQPYMQGRTFLPYTVALPKGTTSQKRA